MPKPFLLSIALLLACGGPRLAAQTPLIPASIIPAAETHGVDVSTIDPSTAPCRDFYQYANGRWLAANPIPTDRSSWGGFSEISERNIAVLHSILDGAVAGPPAPAGSVARKVADFYRSGMDTARVEQQGAGPLAPEMARIRAARDATGLEQEIARLHQIGVGAGWDFGVGPDDKDSAHNVAQIGQGGLGLPDRDY